MAIFTAVACTLSVLATPQTTPSAQREDSPFTHASAFPQETAILFSWNSDADGPWGRAFAAMPAELRSTVPELLDRVAEQSGLEAAEIETLRKSSFSVGVWHAPTSTPATRWLVVVEGGSDALAVEAAVDRALSNAFGPEIPAAVGRHQNAIVIGTDASETAAAVERLSDAAGSTVLDSIRFQRFLEQCGDDAKAGTAFASAYVDMSAVLNAWTSFAGPSQRDRIDAVQQALQLRQIFALGYIAHEIDDQTHELVRICFPKPRAGIPALFAASGSIDATLGRFVPADTASFSLFHIATEKVLDTFVGAVSSFDARLAAQVRAGIAMADQQLGIDVEGVLASIGRRVIALQWPSDTSPDGLLVISLRNPIAIGKALRKTRQFRTTVEDGFELHSQENGSLTIAIGEGNLLVSSSESRLRSVLDTARSGQGHEHVSALLADVANGTSSISWTDSAQMLGGLFDALELAVPAELMPQGISSHLEHLAPALGTFQTATTNDEAGLSIRSNSSLGTLGSAFAIGLTTAAATISSADSTVAAENRSRRAGFAWRLGEIARVMRIEKSSNLTQLASSGSLDPELFGAPAEGDTFVIDGYRLAVLSDEDDPSNYALVAWPDANGRGDVFACTNDGVPMVNELLTHGSGIPSVTARDVFVGGRFGSEFMTGWELIALGATKAATATAKSESIELAGQDWTTYQSILAAERGDLELDPNQLISYLASPQPAVAARAAIAVTKLGLTQAVPDLCNLSPSQLDVSVRRQFVRAMHAFNDRRTLPTMRKMLSDPDMLVRAYCAANVGRFKDLGSIDGLVNILARSPASDRDTDRLQALLSLADIGDPGCLSSAAGGQIAGDKQSHAIAFLFQELTPQMDEADEVATLMSVLEHDSKMLRRYAIQRLGELRSPNSLSALEGRLAHETAELRPLLEVSLSAIRGPTQDTPQTPNAVARARAWFQQLDRTTRNLVVAGSIGVALILAGLVLILFRRRGAGSSTDWAAMTAPSEDEVFEEETTYYEEAPQYDAEFDSPFDPAAGPIEDDGGLLEGLDADQDHEFEIANESGIFNSQDR